MILSSALGAGKREWVGGCSSPPMVCSKYSCSLFLPIVSWRFLRISNLQFGDGAGLKRSRCHVAARCAFQRWAQPPRLEFSHESEFSICRYSPRTADARSRVCASLPQIENTSLTLYKNRNTPTVMLKGREPDACTPRAGEDVHHPGTNPTPFSSSSSSAVGGCAPTPSSSFSYCRIEMHPVPSVAHFV